MNRDELSAAAVAHEVFRRRVAIVGAIAMISLMTLTLASLRPLRDILLMRFDRTSAAVMLMFALFGPFVLVPLSMWWMERRAVQRAGAVCPRCRRSVLAKWRYVLETRLCPYCGCIVVMKD